jgi:uncharacterized membrane protein
MALTPGGKATVPVTVTNSGNVSAAASLTLGLAARPAGADDATSDIPIPTPAVRINLKPGASRTFKLKVTPPAALPAAGVFNFAATIDSTNTVAEKDETNNDALSGTTFTVG